MNIDGYYDLKKHIGHKIVAVGYGKAEDTEFCNVAIECEDCNAVLVDFDEPFFDEDGNCKECGEETYMDDPVSNGETYCANEKCENAKPDWGSIGEPN